MKIYNFISLDTTSSIVNYFSNLLENVTIIGFLTEKDSKVIHMGYGRKNAFIIRIYQNDEVVFTTRMHDMFDVDRFKSHMISVTRSYKLSEILN